MVKPLLLLWLCGLCLRMTVLAIPPVIPQIHDSYAMSQAAVGALTSLPVLLFSFAAIPGSLLVARFGAFHVLVAGILVAAAASALRGVADLGVLFGMSFAMGVGIAIMQPALPAVVRDWVPTRIALGTAVYSNGLLVGESLSASLTIPFVLPLVEGNWRWSLAAWSAPVLVIGLLAWGLAPRTSTPPKGAQATARLWWPDWRDPLTWRLGLLSGYSSSLYFATNAFLPDYVASRGHPELLNPSLSALNWMQMPASLLMLLFAQRLVLKRWPFLLVLSISMIALLGLLAMPDRWIVFWSGISGFCNAFLLILTLALPPLLSRPDDVHRLSAAMLTIGYLCAFLLPIAGGVLWDLTGSATLAFAPLIAFAFMAVMLAARLDFRQRSRLPLQL